MRRALIIAPAFPPQGGVGAQRPAKLAKYLPEFGWEPTILAMPVPPGGPVDAPLADEVSHIAVHRVKPASIPGIGDLGIRWLYPAWQKVKELTQLERYSAVYATGGPFYPFLLPWLLHKRTGLPYVLDFRDPWTHNPYRRNTTFKGRIAHHFSRHLERLVVRGAASVITVSDRMSRDMWEAHSGQPSEKFETLYNGYDESDYAGEPYAFEAGTWNLVYTGTVSLPHYPFDHIFDGIVHLLQEVPQAAERFRFHLVGNVSNTYIRRTQDQGLTDVVRLHGFVPNRQALRILMGADAALLVIASPIGPQAAQYDVSGKLFQYLRAGKPVLCTAPKGGVALDLLDKAALLAGNAQSTEEVCALLTHMLLNPQPFKPDYTFISQFNRRAQAGQLAQLLNRIEAEMGAFAPASLTP